MFRVRYTHVCTEAAEGRLPRDARGRRLVGIPVFESWVLEHILGRAHPITPLFWFGPPVAYGLAVGHRAHGVPAVAALFFLGWLAWTLLEYLLHRVIFHFPVRKPSERLRAFLVHGYHHDFPSDPTRLVAPIMMAWPLGLIVWGLYRLALPADVAWVLFAGTASGYVAYDWIHYYTHHAAPRGGVGKWLRAYHLQHHHDPDVARYGVSSPLWDFVFGTYRPVKKAAPSPGVDSLAR